MDNNLKVLAVLLKRQFADHLLDAVADVRGNTNPFHDMDGDPLNRIEHRMVSDEALNILRELGLDDTPYHNCPGFRDPPSLAKVGSTSNEDLRRHVFKVFRRGRLFLMELICSAANRRPGHLALWMPFSPQGLRGISLTYRGGSR